MLMPQMTKFCLKRKTLLFRLIEKLLNKSKTAPSEVTMNQISIITSNTLLIIAAAYNSEGVPCLKNTANGD
jgi:hypothetical protein